MPELPDVERYRRYIESTALHKKIKTVAIFEERLLKANQPSAFAETLDGQSFRSADRHGKYCLLQLDNDSYLSLHFGMSGFVKYYQKEEQAPGHVRMTIDFMNGYTLAYDCKRKLGQIELFDSLETFIDTHELGPDAMDPAFTPDDFSDRLAGRRGGLKSALMNQQVIAGIGNVYSDEVLFQERLHPNVKISDLGKDRLRRIGATMRRVLENVIDAGTAPEDMPESLITRHRATDMRCPACGGKIAKTTVAGRRSCYCPSCQADRW